MDPNWAVPSSWEYNPFVAPLAVSAIIAGGLAYLGWQKRTIAGAPPFAIIMVGVTLWSVFSALELGAPTLSGKLFWANTTWLVSVFAPVLWFVLAITYSQREQWLNPTRLALMAVIPGLSIILVWTTPIPGLVRNSAILEEFGGIQFLVTTFGPWFWVLITYSYVLLFTGSVLLVQTAITSPSVYRKQAIAIVAGAVLPWAGNAIYLGGTLTWPLDLTPFALVGSGLVMGWAMFRFNYLDIVPIAQDTLVQVMSDGVIVLDADDRIVNLNPVAEQVLDLRGATAVGRPLESLYEHASIFVAAEASETTRFERSLIVGGSQRHFSITVSPVKSNTGDLTGRIIVLHDVTEMRETAEELVRYRDRLEDRVEARTGELRVTNERLKDALNKLQTTQDQVVRQNRINALGLMASGIAHDLNNTLSPILGYTDLLLYGPNSLDDKEDVKEKLETVKIAALDAAKDISRMRQLYKSREKSDDLGPVDLSSLVKQVILLTRPNWKDQAQAKGVRIDTQQDHQNVALIEANEADLREVLVNMVLNAVDAMPEGGTISFTTRSDSSHAYVDIADTGIGMSDEVVAHCFDLFYSTKGDGGTGLGLGVADAVIKRRGGEITVASELGFGTTFTVRMPIKPAVVEVVDPEKEDARPAEKSLHILVAEDLKVGRQLLVDILTQQGHTVVSAADGKQASQRLLRDEKSFDLIVTDMAMPEMSGVQLASFAKSQNADVPVILLTGFGMLMDSDEKPTGVDLVLSKPVSVRAILDAISEVME